jgi:hypothetical protein
MADGSFGAQLPAGPAPRHGLQPGRDQQHRHADRHVGYRFRAAEGLDADGDREQPTDDEDADGCQQRPDVAGLPVGEGVPLVGGTGAAPDADVQQHLIECVGD